MDATNLLRSINSLGLIHGAAAAQQATNYFNANKHYNPADGLVTFRLTLQDKNGIRRPCGGDRVTSADKMVHTASDILQKKHNLDRELKKDKPVIEKGMAFDEKVAIGATNLLESINSLGLKHGPSAAEQATTDFDDNKHFNPVDGLAKFKATLKDKNGIQSPCSGEYVQIAATCYM